MKLPGFVKRLWTTFKSPSKAALWVILLMGFFGGVIFWGGFNTAMEASNTEAFCTGCHEMKDNVFVEYRDTIHYANRSGVRASCASAATATTSSTWTSPCKGVGPPRCTPPTWQAGPTPASTATRGLRTNCLT